jgi:iron complex transport system permease protein
MMGSLAGSSYSDAGVLSVTAIVCGGILLCFTRELNAFAIGEDNARHIGVNVRRVRLIVLITVSALIGVCVSVGGTIGFVGLVTPHMIRMIVGPNHKRLLPGTMFGGACFLMLADLLARTVLSPRELPLGVVTSLIGAIVFLAIFFRMRKGR